MALKGDFQLDITSGKISSPDIACGFSFERDSDIGVLLIHGFTSTPQSLRYYGEKLADVGFHIECPLLPGHGTRWQDLNRVRYEDWLAALETALDTLRQRVVKLFLAGLSLGGALALHLASEHSDIKGIVLINHLLTLGNPAIVLSPVLKFIIPAMPPIANDICDPQAKEIAYRWNPTGGIHQLWRLMRSVKRRLSRITQPVLIFKSRQDHLIPKTSATKTMEWIGSERKELIWLENSYHVATLDYDKELICEKSIAFIKDISRDENYE